MTLDIPEEQQTWVRQIDTDQSYKTLTTDTNALDTLQQFEAGEWVDTPDGKGITDEPITSGTVNGMEATDDTPVYAVAMLEEAGGPSFFTEDELEPADPPEVEGVDAPEQDVEALAEIASAVDPDSEQDILQFGEFDYPDSWEESPTPNRVILLDAWSSMGGTFTGCRAEGLGRRLCASIKDAVWMTHDWRGGWAD